MDPVALVVVLTVTAGASGIQWYGRRLVAARKRAWSRIAQQFHAQVHPLPAGYAESWPAPLEAEVGGGGVLLEVHRRPGGLGKAAVTRARARFALPVGPTFTVYCQGMFSGVSKALGRRDVALGGDHDFDSLFFVHCEDQRATRALWSARSQRLAFLYLRKAVIRSDGEQVTITVPGICSTDAILAAMLDVAGAIVGADQWGVQVLRSLPGAEVQPPSGRWDARRPLRVVVRVPVAVELGPAVWRGRPATCAVCRGGVRNKLEAWIESGQIAGDLGRAGLAPAARRELAALGTAELRCCDGTATLTWHRVESRPERLLAGARFVAALAAGPAEGAYR